MAETPTQTIKALLEHIGRCDPHHQDMCEVCRPALELIEKGEVDAELIQAKQGWAKADDEARRLRFALFEIEERAKVLNMNGVADMANKARNRPGHKTCAVEAAIDFLKEIEDGENGEEFRPHILSDRAKVILKDLGIK